MGRAQARRPLTSGLNLYPRHRACPDGQSSRTAVAEVDRKKLKDAAGRLEKQETARDVRQNVVCGLRNDRSRMLVIFVCFGIIGLVSRQGKKKSLKLSQTKC